jgi:adenine/guanine phosphoribosyltransferase-like PRPP-binding protein
MLIRFASRGNPNLVLPFLAIKPPQVSLQQFPEVILHAAEVTVKVHRSYAAAKGGDMEAAGVLASELVCDDAVRRVSAFVSARRVELVPIHALETDGVNEIPAAVARILSVRTGLPINHSIVQTNSVGHTGATGFHRLANQATFDGKVVPGQAYLLVDDFVGQGGTLANLIGFITSQGGELMAATVLTGKPYSAKLAPDLDFLQALRIKHGREFEEWWLQQFGFGFDCLTRSEARYLEKSADAHTIRNRLAAAGLEVRS